MSDKSGRPIVLVGLMGSGKSSVGHILARKLGCRYWDCDEALRIEGQTPDQIASQSGEEVLHRREAGNLINALHAGTYGVLGAAASVVLDSRAIDELRDAWVVWLRVSVPELAQRLKCEPGDRPFLRGDIETLLKDMSQVRDSLYSRLADEIIDGDGLTAEEIAARIASARR